jgi:hypothetical protein
MSSSALLTHWAVWRFIQNFTPFHDFTQKPIAITFLQPLLDLVRSSHMDIDRERTLKRQVDAYGLINGIARRHDNEEIHVTLRVRLAVGIRTEEDDLIGMETLTDPAGEATDRR